MQVLFDSAGFVTRFRSIGDAGDDVTAQLSRLVLSIEAKDHRTYRFGEWLDQARRQAPEGQVPVVVAHRNGKAAAADAFVVMAAADFVALLADLQVPADTPQ